MHFTKNVLVAFLLAPSVLVFANHSGVGLEGFLCGPNTGGVPQVKSFQDDDPFKVCVRPNAYERNFYKVVGLEPDTCSNPTGSVAIDPDDVLMDVEGSKGWYGQTASSDAMGFTATVSESSLISGTAVGSLTCTGDALVEYIGPRESQTYTFPGFPANDLNNDMYAGFCVPNGSISSVATSNNFQWGNIQSLEDGAAVYIDGFDDATWQGVSGPCRFKPFVVPRNIMVDPDFGIKAGEVIEIAATADNRKNGVDLCIVMEPTWSVEWKDSLIADGFQVSSVGFGISTDHVDHNTNYRTYCKTLKTLVEPGEVEREATTFSAAIELDIKVTMKLHL